MDRCGALRKVQADGRRDCVHRVDDQADGVRGNMLDILKHEGCVALIGAIVGGLISGAFSLLAIRQQVRMSLKIENHNKKDKAYRELVAAFGVLIQITHPLSAKIMSEYIKSNQNLLFGDELMSAIAGVNLYGSENVRMSTEKFISSYNAVIEIANEQKWNEVKSAYVELVKLMKQEVLEQT